jgi:hypothetical protein
MELRPSTECQSEQTHTKQPGEDNRRCPASDRTYIYWQIAADGDVAYLWNARVIKQIDRRHIEGALRILRQRGVVAKELGP